MINQSGFTTSDGFPTNAIFGFLNIYFKYCSEVRPTHVCVAFDMRAPTFRHLEYREYKANRKGMPDDLARQLPVTKDILRALGVSISECEGFEADDILGTLSGLAEKSGVKTVIVTGDRDSLQLASDKTTLLIPVTRGGKTDTEKYDRVAFIDKYGIEPELFVDVKGLMGDSSDNIPGVAGIGEKTALQLVKQFGNLESIYQNIENISKKSVKEKISTGRDVAFLSRELATICKEAPCGLSLDDLARSSEDRKSLYRIFKQLQFQSYIQKMSLTDADLTDADLTDADMSGAEPDTAGANSAIIIAEAVAVADAVRVAGAFEAVAVVEAVAAAEAVDAVEIIAATEAVDAADVVEAIEKMVSELPSGLISIYPALMKQNHFDVICVGIAFYSPGMRPFYADTRSLQSKDVIRATSGLFSKRSTNIVSHDIKQIYLWMLRNGYDCPAFAFDTMLGGYVADSSSGKYSISELASTYLDRNVISFEELEGKGKYKRTLSEIPVNELADACVAAAKAVYDLTPRLKDRLYENDQDNLYYNIEHPLAEVLAYMEYNGIAVDGEGLRQFSVTLDARISQLTAEIIASAGEDFNINSPKQLGVILYEKLGLKPDKKTKTGFSTNIDALEDLIGKHDIIAMIIEYRQLTKLKSTYADGLAELVNPNTGRIYTTLNQAVTSTGRISSTEPNLQNIPVRLDLGREIRRLFIPGGSEYVLMGADYSQIELRVLAHISEDENMIAAFMAGGDVHTDTASKVFGVSPADVTPKMRTKAKAVNFGIVYGIGEFSLAKDIGVTRREAREYIDSYLNKYEGVKRYMNDSIGTARKNGYVQTIMNRRRNLPEIHAKNFNVRSFSERVAMNTPIQGSAADIIKIAMVKVYRELSRRQLKSALILQVHDELILEVHRDEIDITSAILKDAMENAVSMSVPLVADVYYGGNWKDIKG